MPTHEELLEREAEAWKAFVTEVQRVPVHVRATGGVVPGWSVNDLVYHNGKWAGVAADKLSVIGRGESPGEGDPDDVWQGKNELWAAESKSMTYEEAMARALAERERARTALLALEEVDAEAASWFTEETFDHYQEHTEEISRFADSLGPGDAGYRGQAPGATEAGSST
jgi:hypothetical protein